MKYNETYTDVLTLAEEIFKQHLGFNVEFLRVPDRNAYMTYYMPRDYRTPSERYIDVNWEINRNGETY